MKISQENKNLLTPEVLTALVATERKLVKALAEKLDPQNLDRLHTTAMSDQKLINGIMTALVTSNAFEIDLPDTFFVSSAQEEEEAPAEDSDAGGEPPAPEPTKSASEDKTTPPDVGDFQKQLLVLAKDIKACHMSIAETRGAVLNFQAAVKEALEWIAGAVASAIAASGGQVGKDALEEFGEIGKGMLPFKTAIPTPEAPQATTPPAGQQGTIPGTGAPPATPGRKKRVIKPIT